MQRQRTRDTAPELALRRLLHEVCLRYRADTAPLPGVPRWADLVFGPSRVAVFVDGCFWHGCPEQVGRAAKGNPGYWSAEIYGSRRRDRETDRRLTMFGLLRIFVWEHEPRDWAAARRAKSVRDRRAADPACCSESALT